MASNETHKLFDKLHVEANFVNVVVCPLVTSSLGYCSDELVSIFLSFFFF